MDPEGIKIVGAYLTYYAGIFVAAFAWEIVRTVLLGVMLLIVLRKVRKG